MIRATKLFGVALPARNFHAAVRTHIGKRVKLSCLVAGNDERFSHRAQGEVVAGASKFLGTADAQPILHEEGIFLAFEDIRRGVDVTGNMARLADRRTRARNIATERFVGVL